MWFGAMAKSAEQFKALRKAQKGCLSLFLSLFLALGPILISGCNKGALMQSQQNPPKQVIEPEPEQKAKAQDNPIDIFFKEFYAAYLEHVKKAQGTALEEVQGLENTLALNLHIQRLQQIFLAVTKLEPGGESEGFEGMLIGPFNGYGSIRKFGAQALFSCSLLSGGEISGSLFRGRLVGEWLEEGRESRKGEILKSPEGFYALCAWDGQQDLLFVDNEALWFKENYGEAQLPLEQTPEDWASWRYFNGTFIEAEAFSKRITEGE